MKPEGNENWFFPVADFGTKQGLNDTGVETFLDNPLESLVRETIQNSLDARPHNSTLPVVVKFDFFDKDINSVPGIESLKNGYIPAALTSWSGDSKEYAYLKTMRDALNGESAVKILRIADYNTTGLDERNWDALITETGVSSKSNNQAAGSKGIGKNAPFASSQFRMVMYSTKTTEYERSIGVMVGVSYKEGDDGVSQARAYLGSSHNNSYAHQYSFHRDRNDVGTDVFVVGVKREYSESQGIIVLNVLEHFMLSIHNGTLEVQVDNDSITKESLPDFIEELSLAGDEHNDRLSQVKNYYNVLNNEYTQVIYLDQNLVDRYSFIHTKQDASFLLLNTDTLASTNRVLMARRSGMRIKVQQFRAGVLFAGVFQAVGPDLNAFLRSLESAEHNDWTAERADGESEQLTARAFLRDLTNYLRGHIIAMLDNSEEEAIDAYGLAELLPDEDSLESSAADKTTGSITTALSGVTVKPPRQVKQQLKVARDEPNVGGGSGGDEPGEDVPRTPVNKPDSPPSPVPNPDPPRSSPALSLIEVHDAKIRPVEKDYKQGIYTLRVLPSRMLMNAQIRIAASGESGDYAVKILSAENAKLVGDDTIVVGMLPADTMVEIPIQVNYGYRIRMKAVIYENK